MRSALSTMPSPAPSQAVAPPSLGWMLLLAVALFSLALPIIGPLDDHHFAERAHNHDHIYLNGHPVGHHHAYDGLAPARPSPVQDAILTYRYRGPRRGRPLSDAGGRRVDAGRPQRAVPPGS